MRAFVQRPLAFTLVGLAALLSGRALAQADSAPTEQPEEITVRGGRSLTEYRLEMERARDEVVELFNELNSSDETDVTCQQESQTGTRTRQRVCRSNAARKADADAANRFLDSLFFSSGGFITNTRGGGAPPPAGGAQVNSTIGMAQAQGDAVSGGAAAQDALQTEMERLLREQPELYRAVTRYVEAENEYNRARGAATAPPELNVSTQVRAPAPSVQCGATATTEYVQSNTIARVNGALSISDCAAASGAFTIALRIRDDSGQDKTLEFSETWQRSDDQDAKFAADYPIGENVFLVNARLRGLTCTCGEAATPGPPLAEN